MHMYIQHTGPCRLEVCQAGASLKAVTLNTTSIPADIKSKLPNKQETFEQNTALRVTSLRLYKVRVEPPILGSHPSKQPTKQRHLIQPGTV